MNSFSQSKKALSLSTSFKRKPQAKLTNFFSKSSQENSSSQEDTLEFNENVTLKDLCGQSSPLKYDKDSDDDFDLPVSATKGSKSAGFKPVYINNKHNKNEDDFITRGWQVPSADKTREENNVDSRSGRVKDSPVTKNSKVTKLANETEDIFADEDCIIVEDCKDGQINDRSPSPVLSSPCNPNKSMEVRNTDKKLILERKEKEKSHKNHRLEGKEKEISYKNLRLEGKEKEKSPKKVRLEGKEKEKSPKKLRLEGKEKEKSHKNLRLEGKGKESHKNLRPEAKGKEISHKINVTNADEEIISPEKSGINMLLQIDNMKPLGITNELQTWIGEMESHHCLGRVSQETPTIILEDYIEILKDFQ